ncbi:unnamed protein product [Lymnaea stagnalis]|uniref:Uncharacterized protein n=1 Tax=Lymnaea stagnalis TaxID=6523 RepID=A0AAV2HPJ8_LYMST
MKGKKSLQTMAKSDKTLVDLKRITDEWKNSETVKGQAHFKNIKLTLTDVQWTEVKCLTDLERAQTPKAAAQNTSYQRQHFDKVKAKMANQVGTHVTITSGVVKGLCNNFAIPLSGLPKPVNDVIGSAVEVDVGTAEIGSDQTMEAFIKSSPKKDQMAGNSPQSSAGASGSFYTGTFSGEARLRGEVIVEDNKSVEQCSIAEVVRCLKGKSKHVENLSASEDFTVRWSIRGECVFHLGT